MDNQTPVNVIMVSRRTNESLTHLNEMGEAHMVDVSDKADSHRTATASAFVKMSPKVMQTIREQGSNKGDLIATARIAGIQAAKNCANLIPLCHSIALSKIEIEFNYRDDEGACGIHILSHCKTIAVTGVEMEALTAASIAALTIYDMCKAIDKGLVIEQLRLESKSGGKSQDWSRDND